MPPYINRPTVLRLGQKQDIAYGMPVAAYVLEAAATLPPAAQIVVVCHGQKGVSRVLAACTLNGVQAQEWKKGELMPTTPVAVVHVVNVTYTFTCHTAVFEIYAGGEQQSVSLWLTALAYVNADDVQRVAAWAKLHTIRSETEQDEQERADVQASRMQWTPRYVRDVGDEVQLATRAATRAGWGTKPLLIVDLYLNQLFHSSPDKHTPPTFSTSELQAIREEMNRIWAEKLRTMPEFEALAEYYGSPLSDSAVLNEHQYGGLSHRRALEDEQWAVSRQTAELHNSDSRRTDFYRRKNWWIRRAYLHDLLKNANLLERIKGGKPVPVTAAISKQLYAALPTKRTAERADVDRLLGIQVYAPDHPKPKDLESGGSRTRTILLRRVLTRCGYAFLSEGRKFDTWGPMVEKGAQNPEVVTSGYIQPGFSGGSSEPAPIAYKNYIGYWGAPRETARDTAFNLTAGHPVGSPPPLQVFLKPGWRALSIPPSYSEDKRQRAEKGAAWLMKTAKQDCSAPHQDWESLLLPSEKSFCSSKDSARVLSKGTNIGRYFRESVCAPEGQRFVNWDIQACHMRIARTLLRLVSKSPYFDDMFSGGDVYAAFGVSFGMTREQAKTATLILLNGGGLGAQGLVTISGLDPSTLPGIYSAWLNNGNNPWLNARKKLVENYGQHLPADKTLAQKISLLMQECENDILQLTVKRMRATPDVPLFRWALPMYDGSLFLCAETDAPRLTEIAKTCAEDACRLRKVDPVVHANHGVTWAEAEEKK